MKTTLEEKITERLLIVLTGPTASGKTDLALSLSEHFGASIVSADSRQIFRELPIGSAQPSFAQLQKANHFFVGSRSVIEPYSAGEFEVDALSTLDNLFKLNSVQLLVGGSGLYIDAAVSGLNSFPPVPAGIRLRLNALMEYGGIAPLRRLLEQCDPVYFQHADLDNPRRIIRALEIFLASGRPYSSFIGEQPTSRPFTILAFSLLPPRETLYANIDRRVDEMMESGLLREVEGLLPMRHLNPLKTVGYSELFEYFDRKTTLDLAVKMVKQHTRNYAKRQLTWLAKKAYITIYHIEPEITVETIIKAVSKIN